MPDVQSVNYKEYEFLVFNCLMRMEEILKQGALNIETGWISTKLEAVRNNLACRKFRVAVLGEFDRGKSSFLNAILGRKVLPVSMKPSTAAICRITYGDSPCAWIKTLSQEKKSIPIDELEQYITKLTAKSSKEAERIEEAVVEYPTIICRNGVDLIDTPGLNDEENMSVLSLSLLENIDLAIFVLNAQYPFSLTEAEFVTDLVESEHIKNIIFAVTHMDLICEDEDEAEDLQVREELLADVRKRISQSVLDSLLKRFHQENSSCVQKYHRIFDNPILYPVSSLIALKAHKFNRLDLLKASGFQKLNDELPQIIIRNQNESVILNALTELSGLTESCLTQIEASRQKTEDTIHTLSEVKLHFAQYAYSRTNGYFKCLKESLQADTLRLTKNEDMFRKGFAVALSHLKTLSIHELRKLLQPVCGELFQSFNQMADSSQKAVWDNKLQQDLEPAATEIMETLQKMLKPIVEITSIMVPVFEHFHENLAPEGEPEERERFFWEKDPIPTLAEIGENWDVMSHVMEVVRTSLKSYQERRCRQVERVCGDFQQSLDERIQNLVVSVYQKSGQVEKDLANSITQNHIEEISQPFFALQTEITNLRENFLNSLAVATSIDVKPET